MPRRREVIRGAALLAASVVLLWFALVPAGHWSGLVKVPLVLLGVAMAYRGLAHLAGRRVDVGLVLSIIWLVGLISAAALADVLPLGEYRDVGKTATELGNARPDLFSRHPFGTNNFGLDILARCIYAARVSLLTALGAVLISLVVGGAIGIVAGYFRGSADTAVSIGTNSLLTFPAIVLLIGFASIFGSPDTVTQAILMVGIGLGLVGLPSMVRLARSNTLTVAQQEYVSASRSMGASSWRVLSRDVLPNVILPMLSYSFVVVAVLIVAEGSLAFLGLGLQQPNPTWGNMIAEGTLNVTLKTPHIPLVPGVFMFTTVYSLNRIGDHLRRRWDDSGVPPAACERDELPNPTRHDTQEDPMEKLRLAWFTIMSPRSWYDPDQGTSYDWRSTELYLDTARTLERGLFDMLIVADGYGIVDVYQGSMDAYVRHGLEGAGLMQPLPYLAAISTTTKHLGLVSTMSTHVYPPYLLAREMATLDHVSNGRAGWNIVTSALDIDAQNFGAPRLPPPQERYDRADEFIDVCEQLWSSWAPDAIVMDHDTNTFADPAKVHEINFSGNWFNVRGPLNTVPGPQGRPLYVQAGGSSRGMDFAASHADVVISHKNTREGMLEYCSEIKERAKAFGRDPRTVKVFFTFRPIIGDTAEEAEARRARQHTAPQATVDIGLANLAARIGMDVSVLPLDEPLTLDMIPADSQGMRGVFFQYYAETGTPMSLREIAAAEAVKESYPMVGTPEQVADQIEELREYAQFDGFAIRGQLMPNAAVEIVDRLVPVLQRRGLIRKSFRQSTLRENLFDDEA